MADDNVVPRVALLAVAVALAACAPSGDQLTRFEQRDGGIDDNVADVEGLTELDGDAVSSTALVPRPAGAGTAFDDAFDRTPTDQPQLGAAPAALVTVEWDETVVDEFSSTSIALDLVLRADEVAPSDGTDGREFSLSGTTRLDLAATTCSSLRVRTSCGVSSVLEGAVVGTLVLSGNDASVRLQWQAYGPEASAGVPIVTISMWNETDPDPMWSVDLDDAATAMERSGLIGRPMVFPLTAATPQRVRSANGAGTIFVDLLDP